LTEKAKRLYEGGIHGGAFTAVFFRAGARERGLAYIPVPASSRLLARRLLRLTMSKCDRAMETVAAD
jgi:hypothetical protein